MKITKLTNIISIALILVLFSFTVYVAVYIKRKKEKIEKAIKKELKECGKDYNS